MRFLILTLTLIFILTAFLGNLQFTPDNPFIAYVFYQLNFLLQHFLLFCVGFCIIIFIFIRKQTFDKENLFDKNYYLSFFQTIAILLISEFFAFVALLAIVYLELCSFALLLNTNPAILGITTNASSIYKILQKNNRAPSIITSNANPHDEVVSIAQALSSTTNFYGNSMLSAIPNFLIPPIKKLPSSLMFIDNTLIVTAINEKDMQVLSPLIGYLFVQEYFPNRHIKSFPKTSVMTQNQFIAQQKNDVKEKLATVTIDIQKMEDGVSSLSATIQNDTDAITSNHSSQADALKQQGVQYDKCLSTGTYVGSVFTPAYAKSDCQKILDLWTTTLAELGDDENTLNQKLQKDQQQLKDYQYYDNFFKAQKEIMAITTTNIPDELGVFQPPNNIQIVVASNNAHAIADYFETLCHEYLHYASYQPGMRLDSSFFEEGLTEYFARQTIQDNMQIDTNIAYPAQVKILTEMMKRIAEPDFADIYFTKDEVGLEKTLDLAYGDTFYADNITLFDTLQYTSDPQEQLQLANAILQKIGGQPLTEKDLFSTSSNL